MNNSKEEIKRQIAQLKGPTFFAVLVALYLLGFLMTFVICSGVIFGISLICPIEFSVKELFGISLIVYLIRLLLK